MPTDTDAGGLADASVDADAPFVGPHFCDGQTNVLFCADFDDEQFDGLSMDRNEVGGGTSTITPAKGLGVNATAGLHFVQSASGATQNVIYVKQLVVADPDTRGYTIELDVRMDSFGVNAGVFAGFRIGSGGNEKVYGAIGVSQAQFVIRDAVNNNVGTSAPFKAWHHVVFTFDKRPDAGGDRKLSMQVDGVTVTSSAAALFTTAPTLAIGNYYGSNLTKADYVIDNLVVRAF